MDFFFAFYCLKLERHIFVLFVIKYDYNLVKSFQ